MTTPTDKKPNDAFAYLLSSTEEDSDLLRIATLADTQIGLPEKPAELQLTGRFSQSTSFVEVLPGQIINFPPDTTILLVSTISLQDLKSSIAYGQTKESLSNEKIVVVLPSEPRVGQTCYIKDASNTSHICNIEIRGSKIDSEETKTLDYKNGSIGLVWTGISWSSIAAVGQDSSLTQKNVNNAAQNAIEDYGVAPRDASYVVLSTDASLTNERVLAAGTNITISDSGPGGTITISAAGGAGSGDVTGPASSTDNAVVRFDGTGGKTIQNSGVTVDDSSNVTVPGRITVTGGTTSVTDAVLGNAAVGSFPYYDGTSPSSFALFGHKDLNHAYSAVSDAGSKNYALVQDSSGNTYVNASTNTYVSLRCNNVSMLALSDNWLGTGTPAIFATGDLLVPTRTDVFLGNYGGASATTVYAGTGDLNVGHNSADRTVNLGTGNNNSIQEVTVGSTNDRSFLLLRAGTGNMILTGAVTTDFTVGHTAGTGDITLGRSTASNTIRIGNANTATGNTQTINIGAGTPAGTGKAVITIGNTSGASSLDLKAGSGNVNVTGAAKFNTGLSGSLTNLVDGTSYLRAGSGVSVVTGSTGFVTISATNTGDVVGPASSTDNAVVRFDSTTGKLIQDSGVTVDDSNNVTIPGDLAVNGGDITTTAGTFNLASSATTLTIANSVTTNQTVHIASGSTAATALKTVHIGTGGLASSTTNIQLGSASGGTTTINSPNTVVSDLAVNGGDLTTTQTTFNLVNTTATTVNIAGGATSGTTVGNATGGVTLNGTATVTGDLAVNGSTSADITTTTTTATLFNTNATTVSVGGAATTINLGVNASGSPTTLNLGATSASSVVNVNRDLSVKGNTTLGDAVTDTTTVAGDLAVNGGDLTTTQTTFNLVNATATTLNIGGAATTINMGAATVSAIIGDTETGTWSTNSDYAVFKHKDLTDSTQYALLQQNNGNTYINSATTSTSIILENAGDTIGTLDDNTISLTGKSATATTATIGQTTGASQTNINAGTSGINLNAGGAASSAAFTTFQFNGSDLASVGYNSTLNFSACSFTGLPSSPLLATLGSTYGLSSTTIDIGTGSVELKLASGSFSANRKISIGVGGDGAGNAGTQSIFIGKFNSSGVINSYLRGDSVTIGDDGGSVTIGRSGASVTFSGDIDVNGGDLTTTQTTFNLVNATATTLNIGGAATTLEIGASTGTTSINNALTVDGNTTLGNADTDTVFIDGNTSIERTGLTVDGTDAAADMHLLLRTVTGGNTYRWGMSIDAGFDLNFYSSTNSTNVTSVGYLVDGLDVNNIDFTGQHRSIPCSGSVSEFINKIGMIVVSSGQYKNLTSGSSTISINESLPTILLSTSRNQKSVFGVISDFEDPNDETRNYSTGNWGSTYIKSPNDDRLIINSLGEGAIWICNINGSLENGDYITTCEIPGYGMKQDDDLLHNYTVAKITMDCNFALDNGIYQCEEFEHESVTYRRAFVGCTYHCG